jgi:trk system potassium uptake protein TrkH
MPLLFYPKKVMEAKLIARDVAVISFWLGLLMLVPMAVGLIYGEPTWWIYLPLIAVVSGPCYLIMRKFKSEEKPFTHMTIVSLAATWISFSLIGALPFFFIGGLTPVDSYFECVSAISTTGTTVIPDPEQIQHSVLFWRAMIAWLGGLGITAFAFYSILQSESISKIILGEGYERLKPSIINSAREILKIYAVWTVIGIFVLVALGIPVFDSFNLSMNAISTTGMDVHPGGWDYYAERMPGTFPIMASFMMLLMMIGAISFVIHYRVLKNRKILLYLKDPETALYLAILIIGVLVMAGYASSRGQNPVLPAYEAVSASTGGYELSMRAAADMGQFSLGVLTLLSLIGGCSGSAAGGLRVKRVYMLFKYLIWRVRQEISPEGSVSHFKQSGKPMEAEEINEVAFYAVIYLAAIIIITMVFVALEYDAAGSILTVTSAQAGGGISPINGWDLVDPAKVALIGTMLFGRLEFIPMFALIMYAVRRR